MRILIVGANGFLARHLAESYGSESHHTLVGTYRNQRDQIPVECYGQLLASDQLHELEGTFDLIYLLAAYIPHGKSSDAVDQALEATNAALPRQLCQRFPQSRIVFASTVSVYGSSALPIDETTTLAPPNAYGQSKRRGELAMLEHANYGIVRFSSLYGLGMNRHTFLPRLVDQARRQGEITLWGDGTRQQDYLHVTDAAEMLIRTAEQSGNQTYLGVHGRAYSNLALAEDVARWANHVPIRFVNEDKTPSCFYDARWSQGQMGYIPQVSMADGLKELFDHG